MGPSQKPAQGLESAKNLINLILIIIITFITDIGSGWESNEQSIYDDNNYSYQIISIKIILIITGIGSGWESNEQSGLESSEDQLLQNLHTSICQGFHHKF